MSDSSQQAAARSWFGYGKWSAPYWFIGPEPGMKKAEGDNLQARCDAWERLGSLELIDCLEHHREFGHTKWHDRTIRMKIPVDGRAMRPPTQDTWRQLIRLLLAFKGARTDNDAVGDYQADPWGAASGETCVAEMSALAARGLATERDRITFREGRARRLRQRVLEHAPSFVVIYGGGKTLQPSWNMIASGTELPPPFEIETITGWEVGFYSNDDTSFVRAVHPTSVGGPAPPDAYWIGIGQRLRDACGTRGKYARGEGK